MARTPLGGMLRRLAAIAAMARRTGEAPDELLDRARQTRERRRFLKVAGGSGTALLAAACAPRAVRDSGEDEVLVVGAGIAGLTAAHRLRQAGVRVRVVEGNRRIGGRMYSLRGRFPDDQVVELGGELIDTGHVRMRALVAELGLALDDLLDDDPALASELWFADGRRRSEREILDAFMPLSVALERELDALGDAELTYLDPGGSEAIDRSSIVEWFDRIGFDGWLRKLIEVAYTTEMGRECGEQSALNLITFLDPGREHFRIFGESDERFHVRGGNDGVTSALGRLLDDVIETDSVLESVTQRADGRYTVVLRRDGASRELSARHVVLAIPFTTLRDVALNVVLPDTKRRAIDTLAYGHNAKLMIGFTSRPWRSQGSNGSLFADLPFQSTWETSRQQPGAAGILTNFTGGAHGLGLDEGRAEHQAALAVAQLESVFPGISAARGNAPAVRMHWPSQPFARGSYACLRPGDWTGIRGAMGEAVGGLHFAGEHCALDNQGFMEGGVESGEAVARELLQALGLPLPDSLAGLASPRAGGSSPRRTARAGRGEAMPA